MVAGRVGSVVMLSTMDSMITGSNPAVSYRPFFFFFFFFLIVYFCNFLYRNNSYSTLCPVTGTIETINFQYV